MKVFRISTRAAMIITIIFVMLLTGSIAIVFGNSQKNNSVVPKIEIVLPEEV